MVLRSFILLLFVALPTSAAVYKWVDEDGKVHYSDSPKAGAEKVVPKKHSNITLVAPSTPVTPAEALPEAPKYQIGFQSPEQNATVRNNNGQLELSISVEPQLASRHRVQLLLDNKVVRTLGGGGNFALDNLDRGEHQLQAQVIDNHGKVLASSPTRTVFLHRHSQLFPGGAKPAGN